MLASPLPIYLGCASLIVGTLGLGASHMLGGGSGSTNDVTAEQPLFAKSVEQAALPTTQWPSNNFDPSKNVDVAYYGPMVELLTQPTSSVPAPLADPSRVAVPQEAQSHTHDVAPAPQSPPATTQAQEQPRAAPREVVRDLSPQQSKPSRRARTQRQREDASVSAEAAATEVNPREARAEERYQERYPERQRTATQVDTERRDGRRFDRRYRDDADEVDTRSRMDRRGREVEGRRLRDDERRVVVREDRGPEQRDVGFSPFRLFGIFDQR